MFKKIAILFLLVTGVAYALPSAYTNQIVYSTTNLTTSAYVTVALELANAIKGVTVLNTGANPVYVAVGAAGSEVNQIELPASMPSAMYIPWAVSGNQRISVIASSGTISSGVLEMNFLFN